MEQLTAAIDEAHAQHEHRDQQQTETVEKITAELEKQTALANAAEEDFIQVNHSKFYACDLFSYSSY